MGTVHREGGGLAQPDLDRVGGRTAVLVPAPSTVVGTMLTLGTGVARLNSEPEPSEAMPWLHPDVLSRAVTVRAVRSTCAGTAPPRQFRGTGRLRQEEVPGGGVHGKQTAGPGGRPRRIGRERSRRRARAEIHSQHQVRVVAGPVQP
ncbi:hypothetical protein ACH47Z_37965 [Streptomyces sp. NPDC020192]|uniref:hypothetical protein n=1 Tax=Streptomyces sp. NPDC020192 TaxID=3365066 RepID=UPI0037916F97